MLLLLLLKKLLGPVNKFLSEPFKESLFLFSLSLSGHPRHPSARVPLQGPGRDGQPALPKPDGGADGVPLNDTRKAPSPVDTRVPRLPGENSRDLRLFPL